MIPPTVAYLFRGVVGATGVIGLMGPTGASGPANGPIGPTGVGGPTGVTGPQGSTGPLGPTGIAGPTGATGVEGPSGPRGLQGFAGATGVTGEIGPSGLQGATGPSGGPIGATGPKGATGPMPTLYGTNPGVRVTATGPSYILGLEDNISTDQSVTTWQFINVGYTVPYVNPLVIDMTYGCRQQITLLGDLDISLSNITSGQSILIKITCDSTSRNLTFPAAWSWIGSSMPTTILADTVAILQLDSWSNNDYGIVANWKV